MDNKQKRYYYSSTDFQGNPIKLKLPIGVKPSDLSERDKKGIHYREHPLWLRWAIESEAMNES